MTVRCELCDDSLGEIIAKTDKLRVVLVEDRHYPGFCRVIWNDHVREMTDLDAVDRNAFMQAVWCVESAVRSVMRPHKINLASLGNMVPHLHWHIIPRYVDDTHFPNPIWAVAKPGQPEDDARLSALRALLPQLRQSIVSSFPL